VLKRRTNVLRFAFGLLVAGAGSACHADPEALDRDAGADSGDSASVTPGFCARDDEDAVRDVFCGDGPPQVRGLSDLQELLGVQPHAPNPNAPYVGDPLKDNPFSAVGSVSVMAHSTSLSGHLVSPINPRVLILGANNIMTFTRGVQRIELISISRVTKKLNFYLLSFEQACNASKHGCRPGDLYTPRLESDWMRVSIHDDEELKNTPLDCRQCHQRNLEKPTLLMRELEGPWTHFFQPTIFDETIPGVHGGDLMRDYLAAKGDEVYGGYDLSTISGVAPVILQMRVGIVQPLNFDSFRILTERYPDGHDTVEPHPSPTWEAAYEAFKRGEQLALPYLDQRATDPDKQRALTEAYRRYHDGELAADELPDLADIYPDDPALRAKMGVQTESDATAEDALIQACGSCHNDVLDQSLSRAKFNIDVSRMDRAELDRAIQRMRRPRSAPGAMPPPEARQLHPAALERLIDYLREPQEADPRLESAARIGMAGGGVVTQVLR
jgi:hypothetical protein